MTIAAILLLLCAAALHTRLARLTLAVWLLRAGNVCADLGERFLEAGRARK